LQRTALTPSGELMLDQQKFAEAVDRFDKAIELDKDR
jgi:hypothetical protein